MREDKLRTIISTLADEHEFRPAIVEKDYYMTIILNNIGVSLSDRLAFKGGTLLNKIYLNYTRLSEDLDFVYCGASLDSRSVRKTAIAPIRDRMEEFLTSLDLKSEEPRGKVYDSYKQCNIEILYPSLFTGKDEIVRLEISLKQTPIDDPLNNAINHFYEDPFTGEDLIPRGNVLSLSLKEAVAEKLKAAITRRDLAIRDYYDLLSIAKSGFNFRDRRFVELFKLKLEGEGYEEDFSHNFGLNEKSIEYLFTQVEIELIPVIRVGESFDLNKVFKLFNPILGDII